MRSLLVVALLLGSPMVMAAAAPKAPAKKALAKKALAKKAPAPVDWRAWTAGNDVSDLASLQRGARDFMSYCSGCHSLKFEHYSRMAHDLKIPTNVLKANLVLPGSTPLEYITSAMPAADAKDWFGKAPPDLSQIARSLSPDFLYQYLKTFYLDPSRPTYSNNLAAPNIAMPDVLSSLQGIQRAVYRKVMLGKGPHARVRMVFDHFETVVPGSMTPQQFNGFVRDLVNFLDYVGEPAQVERRSMGIWVVLFLLLVTGLAWLLKKEYWKDVH